MTSVFLQVCCASSNPGQEHSPALYFPVRYQRPEPQPQSITASDLRAGATHGIYLPLVQWGNFQRYWDKSETMPCEASSAIKKVPLQHQPPSPSFIFSLQTFSQHVLRALEFKRWVTSHCPHFTAPGKPIPKESHSQKIPHCSQLYQRTH